MSRYLLDTNHLSAYLDNKAGLDDRINFAIRVGDRFGICLPVLCEYRAGIRVSKRFRRNLSRLNKSLDVFRLWPSDGETAIIFADIFQQLRLAGTVRSSFDMLIAAVARQFNLILLTADNDFKAIPSLSIENWL